MNYEQIYSSLILKRQLNPLSKKNCYCESHHIKPRSIYPDLGKDKNNIINLTAKEHYVAHHLLMLIYKQKYGEKHSYYLKMMNAFLFTCNIKNNQNKKYVSASLYEKLKIKEAESRKGLPVWNSGKRGIFSDEYRKKISENHADCTGKNNGRYGSRMMYNTKLNIKKLISKEEINEYLEKGWIFSKNLKPFNNGKIEIFSKNCPPRFIKGKLNLMPKLVSNFKTNKSFYVPNEKVQEYLNKGYILGRLKVWVKNIKTGESFFIHKNELKNYLNNGYELGNGKRKNVKPTTKERIWVHNKTLNRNTMIYLKDLNEYIKNGYERGMK